MRGELHLFCEEYQRYCCPINDSIEEIKAFSWLCRNSEVEAISLCSSLDLKDQGYGCYKHISNKEEPVSNIPLEYVPIKIIPNEVDNFIKMVRKEEVPSIIQSLIRVKKVNKLFLFIWVIKDSFPYNPYIDVAGNEEELFNIVKEPIRIITKCSIKDILDNEEYFIRSIK